MTDKPKPCEHSWCHAGLNEHNTYQCFHCGAWMVVGYPSGDCIEVSAKLPVGYGRPLIDGMRFVEEGK